MKSTFPGQQVYQQPQQPQQQQMFPPLQAGRGYMMPQAPRVQMQPLNAMQMGAPQQRVMPRPAMGIAGYGTPSEQLMMVINGGAPPPGAYRDYNMAAGHPQMPGAPGGRSDNREFSMADSDFPALPGAPSGGGGGGGGGAAPGPAGGAQGAGGPGAPPGLGPQPQGGPRKDQQPQNPQQQAAAAAAAAAAMMAHYPQQPPQQSFVQYGRVAQPYPQQPQPMVQQPSQPPTQPQQVPQQPNAAAQQQQVARGRDDMRFFGLQGLLSIIRTTDRDLNALSLGTDLTTLGLNLNSAEPLYLTFSSPFADNPLSKDPHHLPESFGIPNVNAVQLLTQVTDETLLYSFYTFPKDAMQVYCARELYKRGWRYHKELQRWVMKVPGADLRVTTAAYDRGPYFIYDPNTFEKTRNDNFLVVLDKLEAEAV